MAATTFPLPADGRPVSDAQWEQIGHGFMGSGWVGRPGDAAPVFADSTGPQVKIRSGQIFYVQGHGYTTGSSDIIVGPFAANGAGSTRIDRVVLQLSRTTYGVTPVIIQGVAGSGSSPAYTQNSVFSGAGVWQIPLCSVSLAPGFTSVSSGNVTVEVQPAGDWWRPWGVMGGREYASTNGEIGYVEGYGGAHQDGGAVAFHWPVMDIMTTGTVYLAKGRRYAVSADVLYGVQALAGNGPGLSGSPDAITNAFDAFTFYDSGLGSNIAEWITGPNGQNVRGGGWGGYRYRNRFEAEFDEATGRATELSFHGFPWWPGSNHRLTAYRSAYAGSKVFCRIEDLGPSSVLTAIS